MEEARAGVAAPVAAGTSASRAADAPTVAPIAQEGLLEEALTGAVLVGAAGASAPKAKDARTAGVT